MTAALLDTDTLSAVMRQRPEALPHAMNYLAEHQRFTLSVITVYEVLRGLRAKRATVQRAAFERLVSENTVIPVTGAVVHRAAGVYADLHQRGELIGDADILIAATALEHGLVLVTNNTRHFSRVDGLTLENWLVP